MQENNFIEKYSYRIISAGAIIILLLGTTFYHIVEKLSWVNAWYFSVITLATVGYGDITPKTDIGKIFTTFYVLIGIGIIVAFTSTLAKRAGHRRENKLRESKKID